MDKIIPVNERCQFCHKKRVVSLCDMPARTVASTITGVPVGHKLTCDAKLCEDCLVHVSQNFDLCPVHAREVYLMLAMDSGKWKPNQPHS